jgi:hypothetical protein
MDKSLEYNRFVWQEGDFEMVAPTKVRFRIYFKADGRLYFNSNFRKELDGNRVMLRVNRDLNMLAVIVSPVGQAVPKCGHICIQAFKKQFPALQTVVGKSFSLDGWFNWGKSAQVYFASLESPILNWV